MIRDRARLQRRLRQAAGGPAWRALEAEVAAAEQRRAGRAAAVPAVNYPEDLPVSGRRADIIEAIGAHQVVVVAGETGSGKTTQIPKMCLELGRGVDGLIGHTQPRRIAARTVAERLAVELGVPLGATVGYTVRFNDTVGEQTLVKVMTDGILLAEIRRDRLLRSYDTIIVDEAHERSLNIDFLLGYLTRLLPDRPDLKVIVTSATIDTGRFAQHFSAPVVEVSGRTWPVEIRYRPVGSDTPAARPLDRRGASPAFAYRDSSGPDSPDPDGPGPDRSDPYGPDVTDVTDGYDDDDLNGALCRAVADLAAAGPGDILVFLPGERDIRDAADALRQSDLGASGDLEILPLYARLSAAEQHRVFLPHRLRRVVLATNVAETSLTVPGIRFVVDTGLARVSRYSHRTKVQRLPIEPISQASADQRAGRCGRLGPGICVRLYSEEDFAGRPEFTDPEILRTNLASVILQMAAIGLGDIEDFPFLEPPDRRSVTDGRALLEELGAFERSPSGLHLTETGRRLAELPLDPRLARMVVEAERLGCSREVTIIAAALSVQDPRERPTERAGEAAALHARFDVAGSDFLAYVALWDYLADLRGELSGNQFRKRCKRELLHVLRIREWQDVAGQIRQVSRSRRATPNREPAPPDQVHKALLSGLLSHVGMRDGARGDYRGARNSRWQLARSSSLSRRPPAWAMAGELVETDRTWARSAARIEPSWAEQAGAHLVKRTWSDPWWDAERGEARTEERATLYGLPVVSARQVALSRRDAAEARYMFIRHALVEGDWGGSVPPLETTARRIDTVRALEERVRRRDLLAGDDALHAFYESVIPADITSGGRFLGWWRKSASRHPERLAVPFTVLVDRRGGPVDLGAFPDTWTVGGLDLAVRYRYEPGQEDDGATVIIPLEWLNQIAADGFDWGVPGYRRDLVAALVRSLPKAIRRTLGPAPQVAEEILATAGPDDGPLLDVVAARLAQLSGTAVSARSWDQDALPPHLRLTFEVVDGARVLRRGRDLETIRQGLTFEIRRALGRIAGDLVVDGCRKWEFGDLPKVVERNRARAYPALVDEGGTVGVGLFERPAVQAESMWQGTRRLLALTAPLSASHLHRRLTNETKLVLARSGRSTDDLLEDCAGAVRDQIVIAYGGPSWTERGFEQIRSEAADIGDRVARLATIAGGILATAELVLAEADHLERGDPAGRLSPALGDVRAQVDALVAPGFVTSTGPARLRDLLRYLDAAGRRLQRLPGDTGRDASRQAVVNVLADRYHSLLDRRVAGAAAQGSSADLAGLRWMIEELRVSLWAQELGTPTPISPQRVQRALERLGG